MIIDGDFRITGLVDNKFLYQYLQKLHQEKKICDIGMEVFKKVLEEFHWRIISEDSIKTTLLKLKNIKIQKLHETNANHMLVAFNSDIFRIMIRYSLWSKYYEKKIEKKTQLQRVYEVVVSILIEDA